MLRQLLKTSLQSASIPPVATQAPAAGKRALALQGRGERGAQRPEKAGRDHGFFFLYWTLCRCHAGLKVTLLNNYLKTDQD